MKSDQSCLSCKSINEWTSQGHCSTCARASGDGIGHLDTVFRKNIKCPAVCSATGSWFDSRGGVRLVGQGLKCPYRHRGRLAFRRCRLIPNWIKVDEEDTLIGRYKQNAVRDPSLDASFSRSVQRLTTDQVFKIHCPPHQSALGMNGDGPRQMRQ